MFRYFDDDFILQRDITFVPASTMWQVRILDQGCGRFCEENSPEETSDGFDDIEIPSKKTGSIKKRADDEN